MSPVLTCDRYGARDALDRISKVREGMPKGARAAARAMVRKVQRRALENLTGRKSHLLSVQLARFASAQKVITETDGASWGLPSGGTVDEEGTGRRLPMSAIGLLHERGGVIRPTGENKMLRIPLPPAMTDAGLDRYSGMDFHQRMPWDAGYRWFILDRGGRNPIIARAITGAKCSIVEAMYLLVYSETIKPKWWLRDAVEAAKAEFSDAGAEGMTVIMRGDDPEEPR